MKSKADGCQYKRHQTGLAAIGKPLIGVKFGVDALRTIRTSILQLAYAIATEPGSEGFLVLVDSTITNDH